MLICTYKETIFKLLILYYGIWNVYNFPFMIFFEMSCILYLI